MDSWEKHREASRFNKLNKASNTDAQLQKRWRLRHKSVPYEVWKNNLENSEGYDCVEIIPYDPETGTVYLKIRGDENDGAEEKSWTNKLHIPGLSNVKNIRGDQALGILLGKEVLANPDYADGASTDLKFLTQVKYPEPERKTVAVTLVLLLPIKPDLLQDDFRPVDRGNIGDVITQHQPMIEAYWKGGVPITMDTRSK